MLRFKLFPTYAGINKLEFIETTPEHPFYLAGNVDGSTRSQPEGHADLNSNWVGAGHLKVGDKVKQADGSVGTVANVITFQQTREMFNLTVETAHTFYVGTQGWLVHNCPDAGDVADEVIEVSWTNHGYKHFPQKNMLWKDIVKSTKTGDARYMPGTDIEALERLVWENGTPVTNGKNVESYGIQRCRRCQERRGVKMDAC